MTCSGTSIIGVGGKLRKKTFQTKLNRITIVLVWRQGELGWGAEMARAVVDGVRWPATFFAGKGEPMA